MPTAKELNEEQMRGTRIVTPEGARKSRLADMGIPAGDREHFMRRCLEDTGVFARHVLGYDYDQDPSTPPGKAARIINKGSGGIRADGPNKELTDFIDSDAPCKLLLASRGSRKTTVAQAYALRCVLRDPNIRVAFGRETLDNALLSLDEIRSHLASNETLIDLFGDQRDEPWTRHRFKIKGRTVTGLKEPTFTAWGTDKGLTGNRYDLIIWDDPIGWQTARSKDQMEKADSCFRMLQPLLDAGAALLVIMTPYDEADLSHHIRSVLREDFAVMELDCGMKPEPDGKGWYTLVGEPRWPHMPKEFLERKMRTMQQEGGLIGDFVSQYCLECTNPADQIFFRNQFRYERWSAERFGMMSAYITTDTATSDATSACYSVLALQALDYDDTSYLVDLRVGHWLPEQVVKELVDMVERWRSQLRISGITMEKIALNRVYRTLIDHEFRRRSIMRPPFKDIPRGQQEGDKNQRIRGLQPRFASGRFVVLDTVPMYFTDHGRSKLLFSPEVMRDKEGVPLPDGELVRQLTQFRYTGSGGKKDIPDAIADIDAVDPQGRRYCQPSERRFWEGERSAGAHPLSRYAPGHLLVQRNTKRSALGCRSA